MPQRTMSKCERGSRRVAALLAACTTISGYEALSCSAQPLNVSSWRAKNWSCSSSAVAKWVIAPASSTCAVSAASAATRSPCSGSRVPSRPMPLSSLTCTRPPPACATARNHLLAPHDDVGLGRERFVQLDRAESAHHKQSHLAEARAPQLDGLVRTRHRKPRRASRRVPRAHSAPPRGHSRRP